MAKVEEPNHVAELFDVLKQTAEVGELESFAEEIMLLAEKAGIIVRDDEGDDDAPPPPSPRGPIKGTLHLLEQRKRCNSLTDALKKFCRWAVRKDPDFPTRLLGKTNAVKPPGTHGCGGPQFFKVGKCHVRAYHSHPHWRELMQLICAEIGLEFGKDIRYETLALVNPHTTETE